MLDLEDFSSIFFRGNLAGDPAKLRANLVDLKQHLTQC